MAKILIVEDDRELAGIVRSSLELDKHTVEVFHTGSEGRAKLLGSDYDVIILDWELPEVTGIEMLKEFRDRGGTTPVLMLTGKDKVEDKEAGLDCGADDYLTKPFEMKELGARIRAALRRSSKGTGAKPPSIANIYLDSTLQRAVQTGRSVALTPKEYQFLEFLCLNQNKALTGEEYLENVWPGDKDITIQILVNTIKRLRKKLDPEAKIIVPHLSTKRMEAATRKVEDTKLKDTVTDQSLEETSTIASTVVEHDEDDFDLMLGTTIDEKYEILEFIGRGGMGLVYKARHRNLNTTIAVKALFPHLAFDQDVVKRFRQEAQIVSSLSHPNIMTVHDFGVSTEGQPYLVMEFIRGDSLSDLIDRTGKLSVEETIVILRQVCDGLAYAHENGAVHRDIKSRNIMMVPQSDNSLVPKIVDFGLAKPTQQDENFTKLTQTGDVFGSPLYMSPEQCRGWKVDHRTDIYAVGCLLFEMLTGRTPIVGRDSMDTIMKQISEPPPNLVLEGVDAHVREQLDRICLKCLAKDRDDRYNSARELKADIDEVMNEDKSDLTNRASTIFEIAKMKLQNRKQKLLHWLGQIK